MIRLSRIIVFPRHKESLNPMHFEEFDFFYISSVALFLLFFLLLRMLLNAKESLKWNSQWFLIGWNVALTSFLVTLVFVGGETWYRFCVDRTDAIEFIRFATRWKQRHYRTNEQGWRDNVQYEIERQASRRLTLLGDSFAAGSGIKNVEDRFSNILRSRLPDTEVHVLAKNGYASPSHLKTVNKLLDMNYPTDAVILVYMMNDISPWDQSSRELHRRMRHASVSLTYLQRESYLLNTLSLRWRARQEARFGNYLIGMKEAYAGPGWEQNVAVLREIRQCLNAVGIPLSVVTFPFMHDLKEYAFEAEHQSLGDFWRSENVPHLDLLPLLQEHSDRFLGVNRWDAHPNEYTNLLAADAIQAFLAKQGFAGTLKP